MGLKGLLKVGDEATDLHELYSEYATHAKQYRDSLETDLAGLMRQTRNGIARLAGTLEETKAEHPEFDSFAELLAQRPSKGIAPFYQDMKEFYELQKQYLEYEVYALLNRNARKARIERKIRVIQDAEREMAYLDNLCKALKPKPYEREEIEQILKDPKPFDSRGIDTILRLQNEMAEEMPESAKSHRFDEEKVKKAASLVMREAKRVHSSANASNDQLRYDIAAYLLARNRIAESERKYKNLDIGDRAKLDLIARLCQNVISNIWQIAADLK